MTWRGLQDAISVLVSHGTPRIEAVKIAAARGRVEFFKRHPRGALPTWLAFPAGFRLREHYTRDGNPMLLENMHDNPRAFTKVYCPPCGTRRTFQLVSDDGKGRCPKCGYERFLAVGNAAGIAKESLKDAEDETNENPSPAPVQRAKSLYKRFTGRSPEKIQRITVRDLPKAGVVFGRLSHVGYVSERDGEQYLHTFRQKSRPLLVASDDGKQVLIVGGRYAFTERGIVDK